MRRPTVARLATAVALIALLALAGCTSKKDDDAEATTTTTTALPAECEEFADEVLRPGAEAPDTPSEADEAPDSAPETADEGERPTQTTLPPRCADALFSVAVEQSASDEVKELDPERRLGFAHGVCAYAAALTIDGTEPPTYKEFVATTAESWEASPEVVEEIVEQAATLCPGQLAPLTDLQTGASELTLRLQVTGTGTAQVSYLAPDGTTVHDEVSLPFDHEVTLPAPSDYRLSGRIPDGAAECSIMIGDTVVVEHTTTPGEEVVCAATGSELRAAAL